MRTGPGRQYPIEWVYTLKGLPFEVVDEDGPWRQVKDIDGATGWIHVTLLTGHRTAMITGRMHKLYADPDPRSPLRLTADPGVIGDLLACQGTWCRLEIDGTKAWTERKYLWGVFPREEFK
ncbi:SH3 domain-containing protein [Kordiimonas marina]|uniref:SH3 domain-containing protein n=1 Tax=Kordiimonas marina TaxID=2872312 RepID=UPI001FF1B032|nr:SH3 domain-containing protein [Kordiimonas marina]MCJ9428271.1 hypothetical protein [Kordiimonas marina]